MKLPLGCCAPYRKARIGVDHSGLVGMFTGFKVRSNLGAAAADHAHHVHHKTRVHTMKIVKLIAICALAVSAGAGFYTAFAHSNAEHAPAGPVAKEQKDWGIAGSAQAGQRTITLAMTDDMRFTPNHFTVKQGETVRLRVLNQGQLMHEVVLGTQASLNAHAQMMLQHPGMAHAEPYMAHVAPGKQEDVVWHFNRAGSFDFACLVPGHFQSGMTGSFTVTP